MVTTQNRLQGTAQLSAPGSVTLLAVASLTIMVGCVIVPGLTVISTSMGVGDAGGWMVTVPSLGVVVFGPIAARIIGRLGMRTALCFALFAYGLLGCGGVLLSGPLAVFADRLLLGGATAIIWAAGTGLISSFYEGQTRLVMLARQGMAIELGGVIFLFLGGLLAAAGWQWPFLLYLSAWLLLGLVLWLVPATDTTPQRDRASGAPGAEVKRVYLLAAVSMTIFFVGVVTLPARLHSLGADEPQTGYFLSFVSLMAVVAAGWLPRVVRRLRETRTLCVAFVLYAASHALFATADAVGLFVVGGVCLGFGFGLSIPLANNMAVSLSTPHERGRNLTQLSMAVFAGQFVSAFVEFLPGSDAAPFLAAALVAAVAATVLAATKSFARSPAPTALPNDPGLRAGGR